MSQLPVFDLLSDLRTAFSQHNQVILEAPTGAGKSTALPLAMLDWPEITGKIIMLEPRRVATRSVARYIAAQRYQVNGKALGEEVGYRVRGDAQSSARVKLEVVTEGILTRMIQQDPELAGIGMIIFDEIHERHLTTDLGLALALEVQQSFREDLAILAMSATLSGMALSTLMPEAISLKSEGRSFPVEVIYQSIIGTNSQRSQPWLEPMGAAIVALLEASASTPDRLPSHKSNAFLAQVTSFEGLADKSLLAFLPGQNEIRRLQTYLDARLDHRQYVICPLYGSLPPKAQDQAIAPAAKGVRKIVLATNVAESSLTIEGIGMVVDSGYQRQAIFNPKTGTSKLSLKRISQASSAQRSGRAGRLSNGLALRLWGQEEQGRLAKMDLAEIEHSELTNLVFDCAYWGVKAVNELPMLTVPSSRNETYAWQLLQKLALVDNDHKMTPHGRSAYELGCDPRLAHMMLKAKTLALKNSDAELVGLACVLAGVLSARGRVGMSVNILDHLKAALMGEAAQFSKQFVRKLNVKTVSLDNVIVHATPSSVAFLLGLAYPDRIAKARGNKGYQLANGTGVELPDNDPLTQSPWLVIADFQEGAQTAGRVYLAAPFPVALLTQRLGKGDHNTTDIALSHDLSFLVSSINYCAWNEVKGRFYSEDRRYIDKILLSKTAGSKPERTQVIQTLLVQIRSKGLQMLHMNDKVRQLQYRMKLAMILDTSEDWPDISDHRLLETLEIWLAPYLNDVSSLSQLMKLDCYQLLLNGCSWQQQQRLDTLLPTHWPMLTGTQVGIDYDDTGRATLSVRLQEALGMKESPRLAQGKLVVTMALLSPARRPLALTADLASFWQGPYVEVKKEMKGRYPKHLWPDDPANTQPTKFTKKKTLNAQK
ncbi:ATP-dependent helicase HrpB [Shewanella surugensis]|uniref:ATP-dependent helicase HrpB n=1 Tax=Shewanella surugensis TaxID=212020 RepID=A0ABT0L5L6_9GAMM|nr:ATP-dependent helicase HrpB [Shewanella surugensis]MCL1122960.1 ATP-dependent helicase HrpB [Shewanella surugensis]